MLRARLFGAGTVSIRDIPLPGFPHRQPYLLFCYLLLNRNILFNREQLSAVFWGDASTTASRKYLRNAMWRLRRALEVGGDPSEEFLLVADENLAFMSSSKYWLDVEEFEKTTSNFQDVPGHELSDAQAKLLEETIDLYVGDLLEGVYEDWCLYEREKLSLLYVNTLGKLVAYHGSVGSYERALSYGQRILARDNTNEKVHREMMRLHLLSGDRNAALAQFRLCTQILREALGVDPMQETRVLYQKISNEQLRPDNVPSQRREAILAANGPARPDPERAEQALRTLYYLRELIDEAGPELHVIERFISTSLIEADRS